MGERNEKRAVEMWRLRLARGTARRRPGEWGEHFGEPLPLSTPECDDWKLAEVDPRVDAKTCSDCGADMVRRQDGTRWDCPSCGLSRPFKACHIRTEPSATCTSTRDTLRSTRS